MLHDQIVEEFNYYDIYNQDNRIGDKRFGQTTMQRNKMKRDFVTLFIDMMLVDSQDITGILMIEL